MNKKGLDQEEVNYFYFKTTHKHKAEKNKTY